MFQSTDRPLPAIARRRLLVVAAGAIGSLLAACGAPASPTAAPAKPAATTAPAAPAATTAPGAAATTAPAAKPTDPPKPAAAPPAATPTIAVSEVGTGALTVNFWHGLTGADGKTMTQLLRAFVDENPGLKIREEVMAWNIFYQKFPTAVIANTPPDMVITHEWAIPQLGSRNILRPQDDLYSGGSVPKGDFLKFAFDNITYQGRILGVLLDNHGWGVYINTELFKKAGLDPDKPPKSGEEFVTLAQRLTTDRNGRRPTEAGFDDKNVAVWGFHMGGSPIAIRWTMLSTLWQFGGDTFREDGKQSLLNEQPVTQAAQFWHDAIYRHKFAPVPIGFDANDAFANSRLAITMNGSWHLNFIKDRPQLAPPVTKVWHTPAWGPRPTTWMSASVLAQPKQAAGERAEASSKLMVWLSNNGLRWAESGQAPARVSQQNSAELQKHWHTGVFAKMFQEIGRTERQHVNATEIQAALESEFPAIMTNTKPVKDALTDAHNRVQRVLDRG